MKETPTRKWSYTTSMADALLAYQDQREVQITIRSGGRWIEAAPVELREGRMMRIEIK